MPPSKPRSTYYENYTDSAHRPRNRNAPTEPCACIEMAAQSPLYSSTRPRRQPRTLSATRSLSTLAARNEKSQHVLETPRVRPGVVVIKTFTESGTAMLEHVIIASEGSKRRRDAIAGKRESTEEKEENEEKSWGERVGWKICKSVKAVGWIGKGTIGQDKINGVDARPAK